MQTIDKQYLVNYVNANQVVWQKWDGLIEVSGANQPHNNPEFRESIEKCDIIEETERETMLETSFHDLAEWSTDTDMLILCDNEILLCIPKSSFNIE